MSTVFRKIVPVLTYDEYTEGPSVALVELDEKEVERIHLFAATIKKLKVVYIEDWGNPSGWHNSEYDIENLDPEKKITNKTTADEAALLINDEDIKVSTLVKCILKGVQPDSPEAFQALCDAMLTEWDGRTECDFLRVSVDDIHFRAYIKHTDVLMETEGIPLSELPRPKAKTKPKTK